MKPRTLILASASPRRRELLAELGRPFTVEAADIDEQPWPKEMPASYALRNAAEKAREIWERRGAPALILAADTIVVRDQHILEKPADTAHATAMLRALSGRTHEVITGVCLLRVDPEGLREWGEAVRTTVRFRALTDEEVADYVASGEPMDKAGAYAIQGGAARFVEGYDGSYTNVIGLPMETVARLLRTADA
jgi:septum formation protein